MSEHEFDILIIGSGAAGCVIAGHLAEKTKAKIIVLEAGSRDKDPLIHIPAGYGRILAKDHHVWPYDTIPQHGTTRRFRMGKVVGGGSSINAMCYVRGQKRDFDSWYQASGRDGDWSFENIWKTFIEQEKSDTFHNKHHGIDGSLAVQLPHGINTLNQYCLKAFQEYGLPYNPDYNGDTQIGVSPVQSNVSDGKRCSAYVAHLRRHVDSGRVILQTDTVVRRILFKGNKAVGVETGDGTRLMAKNVIVSAGAVQTPKILMHSGIGPADHLQKFGIQPLVNLPGVGENLHDHPIIPVSAYVRGTLGYQSAASGAGALKAGMRYYLTKDGPASGNGIETVSYWDPQDFSAEPTVQCYHEPIISDNGLTPTGTRSGITFALVVLQPRSRGSVRLGSRDPLAMPLIDPKFIDDKYDLEVGIQAVKAIRKVMSHGSLASVLEEEAMPGPAVQSDEQIGEFVKRVATTMWHPVGTCRMGSDEMSVVDADLKVKQTENLYVMDASVMPNITSGNTNAPTQALALIGAKRLVKRLSA
ncbi:GMC family oxidoreductase [Pluralibacter gergoviae]|uniref:GMC family oxidoreductase n=1 Tax=Pluralibacter gergoviae TaxID=61647 RepID=UPI0008DC0473|nr:GMC oxidoreductase [Pluralibacter gergoviae]EKW6620687.1 GMC family oxidoreductase N-terminal domain-containing protein [Pluralibacter gergoviae]ELG9931537.1 GMC family oxidoreductase N-terminal domain-containing protein [Pluralibacter gergoviae]ELK5594906.1 GMC family oxidoreductase N-terminal domain-containing protein [Pluralibacter gergoviae]MDU4431394.1 GMC family oxidoreductase N-terminal domain-containing protein [Pluralibacter gergoviae]OHY70284.1 glucose-methanol-choline oxidoreduct